MILYAFQDAAANSYNALPIAIKKETIYITFSGVVMKYLMEKP